jgi:hypothetical protein
VQEGERGGREQKEARELLEKRRGTNASLYLQRTGLADAAGGEGPLKWMA